MVRPAALSHSDEKHHSVPGPALNCTPALLRPGGCRRQPNRTGLVSRADDDHAFAIEGVAETGFVGIVIAWVAVAHAGNVTSPFDVECHQVVGCRDDPALRVKDIDFNRCDVFPVRHESRAICL
jgi:hypothetical protein